MLELKNISKKFSKDGQNIEILKNINYKFKNGNMYAIFGQSGSGKTTLINILGLLENATDGKYTIDKKDVTKLNSFEVAEILKNNIGFVFQNVNLNEYMTAIENVELPMIINKEIKKNDRKLLSSDILNKFGLKKREYHFPKELSGGEKQRVCIARAVANNPKVILCDEPTSSLDKNNTIKVFETLRGLAHDDNLCVIVVSHDEKIFEYADYCLELKDGSLIER